MVLKWNLIQNYIENQCSTKLQNMKTVKSLIWTFTDLVTDGILQLLIQVRGGIFKILNLLLTFQNFSDQSNGSSRPMEIEAHVHHCS